MDNIYYCYVYLDKTKPGNYNFGDLTFEYEPFYVGKGKNKRAFKHLKYVKSKLDLNKSFNYHFYNKIQKLLLDGNEPDILIVKNNLLEEEAYELEIKIIESIGLNNLTNMLSGGEGARGNKGFFGKHHTLENIKKLSETHMKEKNPMYGDKYFRSEEGKISFIEKMSGENHHYFNKHRSKETRDKISKKLQGFEWSDKEKQKRSEGMKRVWKERKEKGIIIKRKQ